MVLKLLLAHLDKAYVCRYGFSEDHLAGKFNKMISILLTIILMLASDGDLMEGISHETASFAAITNR